MVVNGNSIYRSQGNCLIETATKTLVVGCKNSIIPNDGSVVHINDCAFYNCIGLMSLTIPDIVISVGDFAFYGCGKLTSITIPNSVTSIGYSTFYGCSSLRNVVLPFVGNKAGMTDKDDNKSQFGYIFGANIPDSLKSVTITSGDISSMAFRGSKLESVILGSGVISIGDYAFSYCTELTSITIPDSVTSIGDYAFDYCYGLVTIYYNGTVEQWDKISIGSGNNFLINANRYYSESESTHNLSETTYN